jgi:hypothetical protein
VPPGPRRSSRWRRSWRSPGPRLTPANSHRRHTAEGRLIATGGTISNRTGGRLTSGELIESMRGIERYAHAESEQFANTSSAALTLDQWLALARRINTLFAEDTELAGIVVTSGTDTLEETAYFLNLTVRSDKPVVVVGSMRNPSTLGYEGAANLLEGFRVAAEPQSRGKGVLVVLNDEINAAREVTKTDALRLQTFQTRGYGVLGVVDSDRVVYYRDVVKRHTKAPSSTSRRSRRCRASTSSWCIRAQAETSSRRWSTRGQRVSSSPRQEPGHECTRRRGNPLRDRQGVVVVTSTRAERRTHRGAQSGGSTAGADANDSVSQDPQRPTGAAASLPRIRPAQGADPADARAGHHAGRGGDTEDID